MTQLAKLTSQTQRLRARTVNKTLLLAGDSSGGQTWKKEIMVNMNGLLKLSDGQNMCTAP